MGALMWRVVIHSDSEWVTIDIRTISHLLVQAFKGNRPGHGEAEIGTETRRLADDAAVEQVIFFLLVL